MKRFVDSAHPFAPRQFLFCSAAFSQLRLKCAAWCKPGFYPSVSVAPLVFLRGGFLGAVGVERLPFTAVISGCVCEVVYVAAFHESKPQPDIQPGLRKSAEPVNSTLGVSMHYRSNVSLITFTEEWNCGTSKIAGQP